jgi:hypothetical protein
MDGAYLQCPDRTDLNLLIFILAPLRLRGKKLLILVIL